MPPLQPGFFQRFIVAAALLLCCCRTAHSQENYFYKHRDFGSESQYNPLSLVLNGSYDILQVSGLSRNIFAYDYGFNTKHVFKLISSPLGQISNLGWGQWLTREVFPLNFSKTKAQWWPNYQLHLIGGGLSYAMMAEWYKEHGAERPELWSIGTMAVYHLMNEIIENKNYPGNSVDALSDIYLFDIGGIVLFSSDKVKKFFSEELNLTDWSLQPSFTLPGFSLENNGQYFAVKWQFPRSYSWHLFYYFGMNGLIGLSYKMEDGSAYSFGAGLRASVLKTVSNSPSQQTADLVWNAGFFYDRDNSLLASVFLSGLTYNTFSVNIYPGLLKVYDMSPGFWVSINADRTLALGLTTRWAPGVAIK